MAQRETQGLGRYKIGLHGGLPFVADQFVSPHRLLCMSSVKKHHHSRVFGSWGVCRLHHRNGDAVADSMPVSFLLPFGVGLVLQPNQFHTTLHNQFIKLHDVPSCPGFFPSFPRLLCRWRHLPRLPREFLQGPQGLLPRPLAASHGNPNEMGHGFHGDVKLPEGM